MADDPLTEDELFKLLGNERRMAILQTLWDRLDVEAYMTGERTPVSFTDLRTSAGISDVGNFNYHLGELEGRFLEARDDGYVLSPLGYNVLQAIKSETSFEYWTVEPTVLEDPCPFCDGTLEASYQRELLHVRCLDCNAQGDGNVNRIRVPASGPTDVDLGELLELGVLRLLEYFTAARLGICRSCRGSMAVSPVPEGDDEEPYDASHLRTGLGVRARCSACGSGGFGPLYSFALGAPSVQAFFARRGAGPDDGLWRYRLAFLRGVSETGGSERPLAGEYTFAHDGDRHRVRIADADRGLAITPVGAPADE